MVSLILMCKTIENENLSFRALFLLQKRQNTAEIDKRARISLVRFSQCELDHSKQNIRTKTPYLRSSDQEIDCADIGISAPSAKLIQDGNRFLGLRHFGEIYRKPQHHLYKKTLLTLTKLIYLPIAPVNIKIIPNYREKPTL